MTQAYRTISVDRNDGFVVITLNHPATLNALSTEMVDELIKALAIESRLARAIVLTGAGRGFCTGADLRAIPDLAAPDYDAGYLLETHYNKLMLAIRALTVPLITAVNGPAAGLGATMALAGDIIMAAQDAFFQLAFARIGLVPDGGSAYLLIHAVGRPRAMEIMLLGERVMAAQALEWGMINRMVEPASLLTEAVDMARKLASGPTLAIGFTRGLGWAAMEGRYQDLVQLERELQKQAGRTADHREGVSAFLEKRSAEFSGQ